MPSDAAMLSRTFYSLADGQYVPLAVTKGPWHPNHQNGAAISGLFAHLFESQMGDAGLPIARFSLTILGPGLMAPFQATRTTLRESKKLSMFSASLSQERVFATASAACIRQMETPVHGVSGNPQPHPPENLPSFTTGPLTGAVTTRLLRGGVRGVGPGAMWGRIDGEIIPGHPVTPLVQAAIFADFGSGLSGWIDMNKWSFANIDIDMHLLRMPLPGWFYVEASTKSAGNGLAITSTEISDEAGLFANVRQTLFIDARNMP